MPLEYIEIGPVPFDEECESLGPNYDPARARDECKEYARMLRTAYPDVYDFGVRGNSHDFGRYFEVVAYYHTDNEKEGMAAFEAENGIANWDELALKNLKIQRS